MVCNSTPVVFTQLIIIMCPMHVCYVRHINVYFSEAEKTKNTLFNIRKDLVKRHVIFFSSTHTNTHTQNICTTQIIIDTRNRVPLLLLYIYLKISQLIHVLAVCLLRHTRKKDLPPTQTQQAPSNFLLNYIPESVQ